MKNFSKLKFLADKCQEKLDESVKIEVNYWKFDKDRSELKFTFYNESGRTMEFATFDELVTYMEAIVLHMDEEEIYREEEKEI